VFGHKWEPAQGIVVETLIDKVMVSGHRGPQPVHQYVVDVRTGGREFRATIPAPPGPSVELAPGTPVHLEVHPKDGEVRFDPQQPPSPVVGSGIPSRDLAMRELAQRAQDMRAQFAGGAGQAGLEQLMERLPGIGAGTPGGVVLGGTQAAELVQELMAGGDREAARERLRELAAQIIAQSGGRAGPAAPRGPGQPSWAAEPRPFVSGGPQPFGEPQPFGGPQPFDSGTPSTFDPVTPAQPAAGRGTFGEPADVFGRADLQGGAHRSSGAPSQAHRIRALEALRGRGLLTEEQFAERRQQIMDET
jgi:hypothetical protein